MINKTISNPLYDSQPVKYKGDIEACKKCSGYDCCGQITKGGAIEPPFLTQKDIRNIEYYSGLPKDQFCVTRVNTVSKNIINIMKTVQNKGCIFFNKNDGNCKIHSFRPMDCRLFPLDIEIINGRYYWALFNNKKCNLSQKDLLSLLEYRPEALKILGDELYEYASMPVPGMNKIGYQIIMEI